MWVEVGRPRPGGNINLAGTNPNERTWINTDYIVSVKFNFNNCKAIFAEIVSTKPGGCDRTVLKDDDAERIHLALREVRSAESSQYFSCLLDYEIEERDAKMAADKVAAAEKAAAEKLSLKSKTKAVKSVKK